MRFSTLSSKTEGLGVGSSKYPVVSVISVVPVSTAKHIIAVAGFKVSSTFGNRPPVWESMAPLEACREGSIVFSASGRPCRNVLTIAATKGMG